ncbi:MAG TPA: hypothetical protein VIX63_15230 [Vicinamibacterales bacterium]
MTANLIAGVVAVAATASLFSALEWKASTTATTAGFWYEDDAFTLPEDVVSRLGGPLTSSDIEVIQRVSRFEIERAFSGLRIAVTGRRTGFWRVQVLPSVDWRRRVPVAGASFGMGPLGGRASLGFITLAINAVRYAPAGASRQEIVEGMARGVGRAAVHEFAHQITGGILLDNRTDKNSYEYFSADRASQYYGELNWTTAAPVLREKIGS